MEIQEFKKVPANRGRGHDRKSWGKGGQVPALALVLALALLTAAGCGGPGPQGDGEYYLRFGVLPDVASLPLVVALEEGIFEELGLSVDLVYFSKAMERDQAIQAGELDGAISDIIAAGFFKDSGFDIKITSINEGSFALVAAPGSGIGGVADLAGRSIGLSQNTIIEFMVDEILANHGLEPGQVDKEFIAAIPLRREMLLQGQLDAACMPEPLGTLSVEQGAVMVADSQEEGLIPSVTIFTGKALEEKGEAIHKFYQAYREAARLINPDPLAYKGILLESLRFPEEVLDRYQVPYFRDPELPDREGLERYLAWLEGRTEEGVTYEDLIRDDYIN